MCKREEDKTEYIVRYDDPLYPEKLKTIPSKPKRLFVRGNLPDPKLPSVAIIGARECSSYGEDMAKWFGIELARRGVQIISGMARGIDGVSQWAAIRAGGRSFGVLGCGTDICYPGENRGIYDALLKTGGIISEFPGGTQPIARNFPSRNRIISGLADILVVIEAREKSGTLITVDCALAQGKDVFAIPGRLGDPKSAGCNALIHMGAFMALSPGDILEALGIEGREKVLTVREAFSYAENLKKSRKDGGGPSSKVCMKGESMGRTNAIFKENLKNVQREGLPGAGEEAPPNDYCTLSDKEKLVWNVLSTKLQSLQSIYEKLEEGGGDMSLQKLINILMNMVMKRAVIGKNGDYARKTGVCII